jgi:predicted DCC family thiol-disulfide oxidoreductase YuxK
MNTSTDQINPSIDVDAPKSNTLALVYDGECPVCSAYCRVVALRELNSDFEIINARSEHALVRYLQNQDYDLDEGMVMIVGENIYHGSEAIRVLSSLTSTHSLANRLNHFVFRSRRASALLYPILKLGRRALLTLLGRKTIAETRLNGG